jgi:hypothetical protein
MKEKILFYLWFSIKTGLKLVFAFSLLFMLFFTSNVSVFTAATAVGGEFEKNAGKSMSSDICFALAFFLFVLGLSDALRRLSRAIWKAYCNHCLPDNPLIRAVEVLNNSRFLRWWKD